MNITAKNILTVGDGRYKIAPNLYLVVRRNGLSRAFVFRYTFDGKRKDLSLGDPTFIKIQMAKDEALKCHTLLTQGVDPKAFREEKKAPAKTKHEPTFKEYAERIIPIIIEVKQYKNKHSINEWRRCILGLAVSTSETCRLKRSKRLTSFQSSIRSGRIRLRQASKPVVSWRPYLPMQSVKGFTPKRIQPLGAAIWMHGCHHLSASTPPGIALPLRLMRQSTSQADCLQVRSESLLRVWPHSSAS